MRLVWRSSAQIWVELQERAFSPAGGTVRVIVLDNLKEGVLTTDIYDPALNQLSRDGRGWLKDEESQARAHVMTRSSLLVRLSPSARDESCNGLRKW